MSLWEKLKTMASVILDQFLGYQDIGENAQIL